MDEMEIKENWVIVAKWYWCQITKHKKESWDVNLKKRIIWQKRCAFYKIDASGDADTEMQMRHFQMVLSVK